MLTPEGLIGQTISSVTATWFLTTEVNVRELLDVWLHMDGLGPVKCHAHSGVKLAIEEPPVPYEMPELGGVVEVTDGTPAPLAVIAGARVTGVVRLMQDTPRFGTGFVLETTSGAVAVCDIGDDLAIGDWADQRRWTAAGIHAAI